MNSESVPPPLLPERIELDPTTIAVHEASHVVAAIASGIPIDRVVMTPDYKGGVGGVTSIVQPYQHHAAYANVLVAGRVGTELFHRRPCSVEECGAHGDYVQLFKFAMQVYPTSATAAEDATRALLKSHWPAVIAVAGALLSSPVYPAEALLQGPRAAEWAPYYADHAAWRLVEGRHALKLFKACGYEYRPVPPPRSPGQYYQIIVDDIHWRTFTGLGAERRHHDAR
jgi:hypothetical protein